MATDRIVGTTVPAAPHLSKTLLPHLMKKLFHCLLLGLALAVVTFAADAVGKVIHIDVTSTDKMVVEGKPASVANLTAVVSSLVQDREHTAVEIKVPEKMEAAKVEEIKAACRKAGIALFSMATKPGG